MKKVLALLTLVTVTSTVFAQSKETTSAIVAFDATTSIDNLPKAENKTVIGALDLKSGELGFEAAVKNFAFSNPLIQEHFNGEKWMNSEAYPLFVFAGRIADLSKVNFSKNGTYTVPVSGNLSIRNVTKPISTTATLVVNGGTISASSAFSINLSDYGIKGVPIDAGKVSKQPKITVSATFK
jgi:polyisoprenoid-binding protein YceI